MYKNFLFDVDGTLLPMDMEVFIKLYLGALCKRFCPSLNIAPETLTNAIWSGTGAMIKNDGALTNREVFWNTANLVCNKNISEFESDFDDFYKNEFVSSKDGTSLNPYAKKCVDFIKSTGATLIAATNPIFPQVATFRRLEWAGVNAKDFDYITVYENSNFCKPNLKYYEEICKKQNINPTESIMIGNDVDEDLCAKELGFDTFLITDCLINKSNKDYSSFKHGSFEDFYNFLTNLN